MKEPFFCPILLVWTFDAKLKRANDTILFTKHVPMTYEARVYRVTSGGNETKNATIDRRPIFNHKHLYTFLDVCCSKTNQQPKIVHPDRQFIPVGEMNLFGITVSSFGNNLIAASSQNTVSVFSTESLHIKPFAHVPFDTSNNDSHVKVKAKNDIILVSVTGSLTLLKLNNDNPTNVSSFLYITNCNYTTTDGPKHCSGDEHWSSLASIGQEFAYDGAEIIVVSGTDPRGGYGVVASF